MLADDSSNMTKSIFCHEDDIGQFQTIFETLQQSALVINLKVSTIIKQEIAEFACGEIRKCANINCKSSDMEISLLLSQTSDPTLYKKDDLLFDFKESFFQDNDRMFVYCNQCKNKGNRCKRCNSFVFGSQSESCYRCRISICDVCAYKCDNPRCKIKYCFFGDTSSFTSGCGERFLSEIECLTCEKEYKYCHGCEDKYEHECAECKKAKKKKKKKQSMNKIIYNVCNEKKICKKCESDDEHKGRKCDGCNLFVCGDHCYKYGRFCRGVCDKFCCNDCVKKGKLNDCRREECEAVLCGECECKCENCWEFLMLHGMDDDDIEKVLRDGNYSDF